MNINLTEEEKSFLLGILEKEIEDTKSEIHHSDNHDFKEELKKRIKFVQEIADKLIKTS